MQRETSIMLNNLVGIVTTITMCLTGWGLKAIHNINVEMGKLTTVVYDGKEARKDYQKKTDESLKSILDGMSALISRTEFELRIRILDDRIKVLDERCKTIEARSQTIDERTRLIEERTRLIDEKVKLIEGRIKT